MNNTEFYNSFAADYNSMIPLEKQVESKMNFYKNFVDKKVKTAADLGAGSGADSIALAKLGFKVTAFEPSGEMVKQAKVNFGEFGVDVKILNKKINQIDESFNNQFDLVVSLGNTLANIPHDVIESSIDKIIDLMSEKGKAVIQILNYDKVLKEKERIVNITESNNKQFVRFYDFVADKVNFNILSYDKSNFSDQQIITTEIFPYTKSYFEKLFNDIELQDVKFYGDLKLNPFVEETSPNLIIIIEK